MSNEKDRLLRVRTVADYLGITPQQVYRLIHDKEIKAQAIQRRTYRIPKSAFDAFLASRPSVDTDARKKE